jgi:hypothetical protein
MAADESKDFLRLIVEMEAAGWLEGEGLDDIAEAMKLTTEQVRALVDRAQAQWDALKDQPTPTMPLGATVYLGDDIYVHDAETETHLFISRRGQRGSHILLSREESQRLFNELAKRRTVTS